MGLPKVKVFGKKDCGLCEAAKSKLRLMEIPYEAFEIADYLAWHEGWRTDGSVDVQAAYQDGGQTLPIMVIEDEAMSYPQAMKRLKSKKPSAVAPVVEFAPAPVQERELVLA